MNLDETESDSDSESDSDDIIENIEMEVVSGCFIS